MILILTTSAGDYSHLKFIDWLNYYKADYEILTGEDIYLGRKKLKILNNEIFIDNRNYSKDTNIVFNRRWLSINQLQNIDNNIIIDKKLKSTIVDELYEIRNNLEYLLPNALWIPDLKVLNVNKLSMLIEARISGLLVPSYIITNSKSELLNFKLNRRIITKAIGNYKIISDDNNIINPIYTKEVDEELIKKLPNIFCFSFFQEMIHKKREYRILYFMDKCYPTEILSQENEYSKLDSRKINDSDEISNARIIKTTIPKYIENQLLIFMNKINLNIGCIDLLEDNFGNFYFLEVNPVGQISGYSTRANLNFEKEIVEKLIEIDEKNIKC